VYTVIQTIGDATLALLKRTALNSYTVKKLIGITSLGRRWTKASLNERQNLTKASLSRKTSLN